MSLCDHCFEFDRIFRRFKEYPQEKYCEIVDRPGWVFETKSLSEVKRGNRDGIAILCDPCAREIGLLEKE